MKSTLFTLCAALSVLLPSARAEAFFPGEDAEPLDQFLVTAGFTGYILWQAIDLAKENHYQYFKILSAEYVYGSQTGNFSCPLKEEERGAVLSYEDEVMKFTIICCGIQPDDPDYIDAELYRDLFDSIKEEIEEGFYFSDEDGEEDEDDNPWFFKYRSDD